MSLLSVPALLAMRFELAACGGQLPVVTAVETVVFCGAR